jgi:hypothetical protein
MRGAPLRAPDTVRANGLDGLRRCLAYFDAVCFVMDGDFPVDISASPVICLEALD